MTKSWVPGWISLAVSFFLLCALEAPTTSADTGVEFPGPTSPVFGECSGIWHLESRLRGGIENSQMVGHDGFAVSGSRTSEVDVSVTSFFWPGGSPTRGYPDFDGNGITDAIWTANTGFQVAFAFESDGNGFVQIKDSSASNSGFPALITADFLPLGFPDLDGDGKSDHCQQAPSGFTYCHLMDGLSPVEEGQIDGALNEDFVSLGFHDLNGDGYDDHVTQHEGGFTYAYLLRPDGMGFIETFDQGALPSLPTSGFRTIGFPDLNGDGKQDYVIQADTGFTLAFLMDGLDMISMGEFASLLGPEFRTVGFPDLNGDGYADHVMSSPSGFTYAFLAEPELEGDFIQILDQGPVSSAPTPDFQLLGFPDYDCDGRADIAYRDSSTNVVAALSGPSGLGDTATPLQMISEPNLPAPEFNETLGYEQSWGVLGIKRRGAAAPHFNTCSGLVHRESGGNQRFQFVDQDGLKTAGYGFVSSPIPVFFELVSSPTRGYPDFDGNGVTDFVWITADGFEYARAVTKLGRGGYGASDISDSGQGFPALLAPDFVHLGFPDLNGDGKSDHCQQAPSGFTYCHLMDGLSPVEEGQIDGALNEDFVSLGFHDLNGDGYDDHVIQHEGGFTYAYLLRPDGMGFIESFDQGPLASLPTADFRVIGFPDLNGDGKQDLVIQADTGFTYAFLLDGLEVVSQGEFASLLASEFQTVGFPDLNGDGYADHVMSSPSGFTYAFLAEPELEGDFIAIRDMGPVASAPTPDFQLLGFPDYNCDGRADIAYRDSSTHVVASLSGASGLSDSATPLQLISQPDVPRDSFDETLRYEQVWGVLDLGP